jgi:alpha-ketoglutarate-dependent taurine dioxygenase
MTSTTASSLPATDLFIESGAGRPAIVRVPGGLDPAASLAWLRANHPAVRTELLRHGALLIRGLAVGDPAEFAAVRDLLVTERAAYREKATPRSDFGNGVFSSTDLPAAQAIALHNENSYTLEFPGILLFCCLQAPDSGGATTVADVREVLAGLPAGLVERFRRTGWALTRNYHREAGLPWQTAFGTDSRAEVEAYCARNAIRTTWTGEEGLRTVQRRSAIVRHPITGEQVWFNHAAFWSRWSLDEDVLDVLEMTYGADGLPFDTAYGDGGALSPADVRALNAAYDRATRRESWQPGDLLLVDNLLAAHGRESYQGDRRILVAMGEPVRLDACSPSVPVRAS